MNEWDMREKKKNTTCDCDDSDDNDDDASHVGYLLRSSFVDYHRLTHMTNQETRTGYWTDVGRSPVESVPLPQRSEWRFLFRQGREGGWPMKNQRTGEKKRPDLLVPSIPLCLSFVLFFVVGRQAGKQGPDVKRSLNTVFLRRAAKMFPRSWAAEAATYPCYLLTIIVTRPVCFRYLIREVLKKRESV
ncbi:hypothetical protein F5X98DRAFT_353884 [Xylaria grammica]|nr:hypothetical protein F5X98DRAFT_353884 [Xylaria grammica]